MSGRVHHRLLALIAIVLLSLGFAAQGAMSGDGGADMIAGYDRVALSQSCDDCGGGEAMLQVSCYGVCNNNQTAVFPHPASFIMIAIEQLEPGSVPARRGRRVAPSPHPPRNFALT